MDNLGLRFSEYLSQQGMTPGAVRSYADDARRFARWLARHPAYGDALIDSSVRDQALAEYWPEFAASTTLNHAKKTQSALRKLFVWLELPPADFGPLPRPAAGELQVLHYGRGTSITKHADGSPFKARAICADGTRRTTDTLRVNPHDGLTADMSAWRGKRERYRITGTIVLETAAGSVAESENDPLVVKFQCSERAKHGAFIGYGLWRTN